MKPSEQCKEAGLSSLRELETITGIKERTLINWHRDKPEAFEALLIGAVIIRNRTA